MTTTSPSLKTDTATNPRCGLLVAAVIAIAASSGCTSVISSAYLREAWLDAVEHAAETNHAAKEAAAKDAATKAAKTAAEDSLPPDDGVAPLAVADEPAAEAAWSPATLDEAAAEADRRLASAGGLTAAARGTLITMLENTPRQDWPVVIEEFTRALVTVQIEGPKAQAADTPSRDAVPETIAEPVAPLPPASPAAASAPEPPRPLAQTEPARVEQSRGEPQQVEPQQIVFAVRNACFASRVRAWGVVDRFETTEFEPGQDVIVYFELDQLSSRESADGHTTRIDTTLRLVDVDGRRIHDWSFEPVEETCGSRRRDYFARYLLSLPESAPDGPLRLEIAVNDTLAGRTAHATLPLAVVRR